MRRHNSSVQPRCRGGPCRQSGTLYASHQRRPPAARRNTRRPCVVRRQQLTTAQSIATLCALTSRRSSLIGRARVEASQVKVELTRWCLHRSYASLAPSQTPAIWTLLTLSLTKFDHRFIHLSLVFTDRKPIARSSAKAFRCIVCAVTMQIFISS